MNNSFFRIRLEHNIGRRIITTENEYHVQVRTQADIIDEFEAKLNSLSNSLEQTINENSKVSQKLEMEIDQLKMENIVMKKALFTANYNTENLKVDIHSQKNIWNKNENCVILE